jgi:hypothetical protein
MTKKRKTLIETARMTIASVKKEMEMSRLTESVRNDSGYQAELGGRNTCPLREILQSVVCAMVSALIFLARPSWPIIQMP